MSVILRMAGRLPRAVKEPLGAAVTRVQVRHGSRLAWAMKRRTLADYGVSPLRRPLLSARYVFLDPELDNFTYDIENLDELAAFVADTVGCRVERVRAILDEPQSDPHLAGIAAAMKRRPASKRRPRYGRRLGWYALVRLSQPAVAVETGIHDGLGSALLLAALERNAAEGAPGRLISVDINEQAGWLVPEQLRSYWTPVFGSTFDVLPGVLDGEEVGFFIHDSDHTYECERFEFDQALAHAARESLLLSDNAHATSALRDVCQDLSIEYRFFAERPRRHFYPGGGIGLGVSRRAA